MTALAVLQRRVAIKLLRPNGGPERDRRCRLSSCRFARPHRGPLRLDLGSGRSQVPAGQETRRGRPWRAPVAGRAVVTWEGPGEPIMLTLYGADGEVAVPLLPKRALTLAQELLTRGVAAIEADSWDVMYEQGAPQRAPDLGAAADHLNREE